jgi:hypothetical protein
VNEQTSPLAAASREETTEDSVSGKVRTSPSSTVCRRTVIVRGKWLRTAAIKDEDLAEGVLIEDLSEFIRNLRSTFFRADMLTFAEKPPDTLPKHDCYFEYDNWAAVHVTTFGQWWSKLPQESRKNVRRAAKRGVQIKLAPFDDYLVQGIHAIYNETPIRQGRPFWHFGKGVDAVKRENATYLDRSDFITAYLGEELIGFAKVVYVDRTAVLLQFLSKDAHHDKRPANALLAEAIQLCEARGILLLLYGKYVYGHHTKSLLTEFKRRNGFEEIRVPRYFVPLTMRGQWAIKLGVHSGLRNVLPTPAIDALLSLRTQFYTRLHTRRRK